MKLIIALLGVLVFAPTAFAEYKYDWQTGNSYTTRRNYDGSTSVNGFNTNTGSSWSTTIKKNGSQSGYDSNGNMWDYNSGTKTYMNYGTGKMCVGTGYSRICN